MKNFWKKWSCGSHKQCTGPTDVYCSQKKSQQLWLKKKKKEREKCWKVKTHTHKHESKHSQIESNGKSLLTSIEIAIENSTT